MLSLHQPTRRFLLSVLLLALWALPAQAQTATPTPTPSPAPALTQAITALEDTLLVFFPAGWGAVSGSEEADIALANAPDLAPLVGSALPTEGQIMMQINSLPREALTPLNAAFDMALILDELTDDFISAEGENPFGAYVAGEHGGWPSLTAAGQVTLFEQPADAYLLVIDREADGRVLLLLALTAPDELATAQPTLDAIAAAIEIVTPRVTQGEPISTLDRRLTVQTPPGWYARPVGATGLVLAPFFEGTQIERLSRINPGQVVVQVSIGARAAVFSTHSRSVRDLAGWTLLGFRQSSEAIPALEIAGLPAARISLTTGGLELAYLFVDHDAYIVWYSVIAPPGEAAQYTALIDRLAQSAVVAAPAE